MQRVAFLLACFSHGDHEWFLEYLRFEATRPHCRKGGYASNELSCYFLPLLHCDLQTGCSNCFNLGLHATTWLLRKPGISSRDCGEACTATAVATLGSWTGTYWISCWDTSSAPHSLSPSDFCVRLENMPLKEALQTYSVGLVWSSEKETENGGVSHRGHFLETLALPQTCEGIYFSRIQTSPSVSVLLLVLWCVYFSCSTNRLCIYYNFFSEFQVQRNSTFALVLGLFNVLKWNY